MMTSPPPPSVIRRAIPDEAAYLNALTGRSALSWGYEPEFLDWEPEAITVTPEFIASSAESYRIPVSRTYDVRGKIVPGACDRYSASTVMPRIAPSHT